MRCRFPISGSLNRGGELTVVRRKVVTTPFSNRKKNGKEYFVFNQRDLNLFTKRRTAAHYY
jgi:hypothetical protein